MRENIYYLTKKTQQIRHFVGAERDLAYELFLIRHGGEPAQLAYELWVEASDALEEYINLCESGAKKKLRRIARRDAVDTIMDAIDATKAARKANYGPMKAAKLNLETTLKVEWMVFKAVPSLYKKRTKKSVGL